MSQPPAALTPLRVVAFGGGRGLSTLLRGLASLGSRVLATGIVAVTDDGGSTGILRRALALPAMGDARRCLSAVAGEPGWGELLEHRFQRPEPLRDHALGNLLLAAMQERGGALSASLAAASRLVSARCRLLPMTDACAALVARRADGRVVQGQSATARLEGALESIRLAPELVTPAPGVLDAIASADLIVLGPGSLFTSVIASTLAAGIARAIAQSGAPAVLVQNLTTQRGETDGFDLAAHLAAIERHLGRGAIDAVLAHRWTGAPPPDGVVASGQAPGIEVVEASLAVEGGRGRLHDPRRLAVALYQLARSRVRAGAGSAQTVA